MEEKPEVAVLGSGAAGVTLTAYLISRGFEVNLFELPKFAEKSLKPFQERGGIEVRGGVFNGFFEPTMMTTDIKEALEGVDIAMMTVPAFGHETFAKTVIPNLESRQILLNWTSYWFCVRFWDMFKEKAPADAILSEGRIYPFMTRRLEPALVYPDALKTELSVAAMPSKNTSKVVDVLKRLFTGVVPAANVLQTSLETSNVSVHTAPAFLNIGWWEKTHGDVPFYEDLVSPGVGRVMGAQDREKLAIGKVLGLDLATEPEIEVKMYGQFGSRGKTSYEVLHTCESSKAWRPRVELNDPTFVVSEDVPYGLVPMSSLGDLLGVPTPTIDALIQIASLVNEVDYWKLGLTVKKLGLAGMTAKQIVDYVTTGEK